MKDQAIVVLSTPFIHTVHSVLSGWVLSKIWEWFVVTSLENVPSLNWVTMVGFLLIINYLRPKVPTNLGLERNQVDGLEWATKMLTVSVVGPLFTLFLAWIITLLI